MTNNETHTEKNSFNLGFSDEELKQISERFKQAPEECWYCGSTGDYRMLYSRLSGDVIGRGCEANKHASADFLYDK